MGAERGGDGGVLRVVRDGDAGGESAGAGDGVGDRGGVVLFGDGSIAKADLVHDGTQAGAIALIDQGASIVTAGLEVADVSPGSSGTYGGARPSVVVTGPAGSTVRVSVAKGLDPTGNTATVAGGDVSVDALVASRLSAQYPWFPVNNAVHWQHLDVLVPTSGTIDVTDGFGGETFDYSSIDGISGADDFPGDDVLPLVFVAAAVDGDGDPEGPVTAPIYLANDGDPVP